MNSMIKERIDKIEHGIVPEGYKVTKIGINPEDWKVTKLGQISKIYRGASPRPISDKKWFTENKNIGWVRISDVTKSDKYLYETEQYLSDLGVAKSKLVERENIIMSICATVGKPIITKIDVCIHDGFVVYENPLVDKMFLYNYLIYIENKWKKYGQTGSQMNLNIGIVSNESISIPSLQEQEKIADILSTWDKAIEKIEKLIKEKDIQKKGLMQQLLTGETRLPGFNMEWKEVKLGSLGKTFNGLSGKTKLDFGSGFKFITYMNVFKNSSIDLEVYDLVELEKNEKQSTVKYGDIFFTVSSETPNEVGMSSVLLDKVEENIYLNSFCFGFRLDGFMTLLPDYSKFYFRGKEFRSKIYKLAQGSTRFNLSKVEILKLELNLPSVSEQKAIAEILSTADKEIELLKQLLENKKEEKIGLMQLLLTGIVRV